ncbi:MAG: VWA domain-containing protein [Sedimentisphaerales bacterium]|nr:VWA domain-containing protein [Sedimentisphaerales bacterium]
MQWLTPTIALYAASVAIPLLLLMYFLKLKRQQHFVSSTLLWKRAVQDLQVNAPFQKIRRNILLLLQMLAILAVLLALAGPLLSLNTTTADRHVLLIDRSASMKTIENQTTRLELAKKQARNYIESLRSRDVFTFQDTSDQAMIITFDNQAKVMCNFTSDKRQLLAAIDSITPTDAGSSIAQAVTVARAFAQSPGEDNVNLSVSNPAQLVLFSDGQISDAEKITIGPDEMIFNCLGTSADNFALTAMQARRSYENPDELNIFATVANFSDSARTIDIQLALNDQVRAVKSVTVDPLRQDPAIGSDLPGKVSVSFTLNGVESGLLEVRQLKKDSLSADDAAWAVVSPPKRITALLVTKGNPPLETALSSCPLAALDTCLPGEFNAKFNLNSNSGTNDNSNDDSNTDSDDNTYTNSNLNQTDSLPKNYDIIILDKYVPENLPRARYLVFGRPPSDLGVTADELIKNQFIADWRPQHPVLKYVNLNNVFATDSLKYTLPRDAEILAEFNEAPAIVLLRRHGSVFLLVGFDVMESNWPFEPSFVLFCYNAVNFLALEYNQDQQYNLPVSKPVTIENLPPETIARISVPNLPEQEIIIGDSGVLRYSATERAGIYVVEIPDQPPRYFAVNLLNENESNINPQKELTFTGLTLQARDESLSLANLPLWPYLVAFALFIAVLEWLVYIKKVRL